jgi:NADH dehydrogenase FAD-containing subunit
MVLIESVAIGSFNKIKSWFYFESNNPKPKKQIYLLGQGWFAKGFMEHIDKSKFSIINIYRFPFVNTPMLLSGISRNPSYSPIGKFRKLIDKEICDEITSIDLKSKQIKTLKNTYTWTGGYLVCGLGSNTDIGRFWTEKINEIKKLTSGSNLCIVGAGPTGTELAFHLSDLGFKTTLYDGLPEVYTFLTDESKDYILKHLKLNSIELHTNKMFANSDKEKFDQVIFAVGSRSNDLTSQWKITPQLTLEGMNDVFVGGDCVGPQGIDGLVLPKNAQVAYQQGMYVAKKLNLIDSNQQIDNFNFVSKGIALYTGNGWYWLELNIGNSKYGIAIPEKLMDIYYKWLK